MDATFRILMRITRVANDDNDIDEQFSFCVRQVFCHHPLEFIDAIATRHILQAQDELRVHSDIFKYEHIRNFFPSLPHLFSYIHYYKSIKYFLVTSSRATDRRIPDYEEDAQLSK